MEVYLLALTLSYVLLVTILITRKRPVIQDADAFFSLNEKELNTERLYSHLQRTFEATNSTFAISMLGLFALVQINFFYAFYLVLTYLLGIYVYGKYLIPLTRPYIEGSKLLPEVLAEKTLSVAVGTLLSVLLIISLLAFYYTEVLAFSLQFLGQGISGTETMFLAGDAELITLMLVIVLGIYIGLCGYRGIVITDAFQVLLVRVGCLAVLLIASGLLLDLEWESILGLMKIDFITLPHLIILPALVVGFMVAQLTYYENWLRLSLFYKALPKEAEAEEFFYYASRAYCASIPKLILIYSAPLVMGVYAKLTGIETLYLMLESIWQHSWIGAISVFLALFAFISALLSTADTYLVSALHLVYSIFKKQLSLNTLRFVVVAASLSVMPFVSFHIDMGEWMRFLFYSVNGLVGPALLAILGYRLNRYAVTLILLSSFPIAFHFIDSELIDLVAAAMVLGSIAVCFFTATKEEKLRERKVVSS